MMAMYSRAHATDDTRGDNAPFYLFSFCLAFTFLMLVEQIDHHVTASYGPSFQFHLLITL